MEFEAFEPGIEISGQLVYSTVDAFMTRCIPAKILLEKGIGIRVNKKFQIDINGWYPQQDWLDVFKEISSKLGDDALSQIGMKIPELAPLPPWVKDIDSAIRLADISYHMGHRKNGRSMFDPNTGVMLEGIGHYSCTINGDEYVVVCESSYPCDFDKGIITGTAKKFKPNAIVIHDDSMPCRKKGDKSCTFRISW